MLKAQINELIKVNEKIKNDLLSQNYNEKNELMLDKTAALNLNHLLEAIIDEYGLIVKWYPTQFGYSYENGNHKFYISINEIEYSYFISNEKMLTLSVENLLYEVCTFLIDQSVLNELKSQMLNNIKLAKHNTSLISEKCKGE